jgi:hypothetical protein
LQNVLFWQLQALACVNNALKTKKTQTEVCGYLARQGILQKPQQVTIIISLV